MNVNLRISVEQQKRNVDALLRDWCRMVALTGVLSPEEDGIFQQYQRALRALQVRVLLANGIPISNLGDTAEGDAQ